MQNLSQSEQPLPLIEYQPKSELRVQETRIDRARYPVIDIHAHLSWSRKVEHGIQLAPERQFLASPEELLHVMDRKNVCALTNLTGGFGDGLRAAVSQFDHAHPDRFYTLTEPSYDRFLDPNYPKIQAQAIADAHSSGARGLKILKTLGLYLREGITSGALVKVDDPRFDPMWDTCGQLGIPVAIHVSDPVAFFALTDRFNERYEELHNHPYWSFKDSGFTSNA